MKIFTCDICGTDDLVRQGDYFVCQSCGKNMPLTR